MKKPVETFCDGAIYDLYAWYGSVPDDLSHITDKEELFHQMQKYLTGSIGKVIIPTEKI